LAFVTPIPTQNSITFDKTGPGPVDQVVVDFDFRLMPGNGRADGLGFAMLDTSTYGVNGAIAPQAPLYAAEEPNFERSLGIGFDIYRSSVFGHTETNNNHVSIHFDGELKEEFDATPALDPAGAIRISQ
jgi:hypothetical protein